MHASSSFFEILGLIKLHNRNFWFDQFWAVLLLLVFEKKVQSPLHRINQSCMTNKVNAYVLRICSNIVYACTFHVIIGNVQIPFRNGGGWGNFFWAKSGIATKYLTGCYVHFFRFWKIALLLLLLFIYKKTFTWSKEQGVRNVFFPGRCASLFVLWGKKGEGKRVCKLAKIIRAKIYCIITQIYVYKII